MTIGLFSNQSKFREYQMLFHQEALLGLEKNTFLGACLSSTHTTDFYPCRAAVDTANHKLECYREILAKVWSPQSISFPIRGLPWLFLQGLCLFTALITSILRVSQVLSRCRDAAVLKCLQLQVLNGGGGIKA